MAHVIPFQDVQVPDMLFGRILKKTQAEAEDITEPGTMPFFFENASHISCHTYYTFSFNSKYYYELPSLFPSVPLPEILILASAINCMFSLSGMNDLNLSPDVPLHIPLISAWTGKLTNAIPGHDILYINYCRKPLKIPNTNEESYFLSVLNET